MNLRKILAALSISAVFVFCFAVSASWGTPQPSVAGGKWEKARLHTGFIVGGQISLANSPFAGALEGREIPRDVLPLELQLALVEQRAAVFHCKGEICRRFNPQAIAAVVNGAVDALEAQGE